jgi:hypothetical protein
MCPVPASNEFEVVGIGGRPTCIEACHPPVISGGPFDREGAQKRLVELWMSISKPSGCRRCERGGRCYVGSSPPGEVAAELTADVVATGQWPDALINKGQWRAAEI